MKKPENLIDFNLFLSQLSELIIQSRIKKSPAVSPKNVDSTVFLGIF